MSSNSAATSSSTSGTSSATSSPATNAKASEEPKTVPSVEPKTKIAIVTGGNKGIGLACVKGIAKIPDTVVVLTARKDADGKAAVDECKRIGLNNVSYHQLDVTDDKSIDQLVTDIFKQHKRIDWLVNNAGIFPDWKVAVCETRISDVMACLNTNTLGPLKLCMRIVPEMKRHNYGRIVNMSSGAGQLSDMNGKMIGYRVSKTGLNAVTKVFADELKGTGVAINSMCPGYIVTDMTAEHVGPKGPTGTPEQGADTAVWLLLQGAGGPSGGFFRRRKPIPW